MFNSPILIFFELQLYLFLPKTALLLSKQRAITRRQKHFGWALEILNSAFRKAEAWQC